jgi:hypothetical protein
MRAEFKALWLSSILISEDRQAQPKSRKALPLFRSSDPSIKLDDREQDAEQDLTDDEDFASGDGQSSRQKRHS